MHRRQYLLVLGAATTIVGCTGEGEPEEEAGDDESADDGDTADDEPGGGESESGDESESDERGEMDKADVVLEYTISAEKEPEMIPEDIRNSRDEGGRRQEGYKWVVVQFDVVQGTLDMQEMWFHSRIETSDRFYDLDHGTRDLVDGVQPRGEIKESGSGIALYQIPEDEGRYLWNLEDVRQDVHAEKQEE